MAEKGERRAQGATRKRSRISLRSFLDLEPTTSAMSSALSQILPEPKNLPPNAFPLKRTTQLAGLLTLIRSESTSRGDFIFYSDRIIRCARRS